MIIDDEFRDTEDLDGLFSGWDPEKGQYDIASWQYEGMERTARRDSEQGFGARASSRATAATAAARRTASRRRRTRRCSIRAASSRS